MIVRVGYLDVAGFLALVAALFWVVARLQLGSSFSRRATVGALVTTGLYSKLRHPIYIFVSLGILGLILAYQDPSLLTVWVLVVAGLFVKSRREEQTLLAAYGSEYEEYRRKTWF
jgi:protein-S-isoprenylcysteine O-methyltransferase Ste14